MNEVENRLYESMQKNGWLNVIQQSKKQNSPSYLSFKDVNPELDLEESYLNVMRAIHDFASSTDRSELTYDEYVNQYSRLEYYPDLEYGSKIGDVNMLANKDEMYQNVFVLSLDNYLPTMYGYLSDEGYFSHPVELTTRLARVLRHMTKLTIKVLKDDGKLDSIERYDELQLALKLWLNYSFGIISNPEGSIKYKYGFRQALYLEWKNIKESIFDAIKSYSRCIYYDMDEFHFIKNEDSTTDDIINAINNCHYLKTNNLHYQFSTSKHHIAYKRKKEFIKYVGDDVEEFAEANGFKLK